MFRSNEKSKPFENTDKLLLRRKASMFCPHDPTEELNKDKDKEQEIEVNTSVKKKNIFKKIKQSFGL